MHEETAKRLYESYGHLLSTPSGERIDLAIGEGWASLLDDVLWWLDQYQQGEEKLAGLRVLQVKEKFGALRVYVRPADAVVSQVLLAFELISMRHCERCGALGRRRTMSGVLATLCDAHAEEYRRRRGDEADGCASQ